MYIDTELTEHRHKIYYRVAAVLILLLLFVVNITGLFAGAIFYSELCLLNTRLSLLHFSNLRDELQLGKQTKNWYDVSIESRLGYVLKGTYLPNPTPSANTIIFVHGITANRLMGLRYAGMYLDDGYNVLIYDSRAHGESGGEGVTWGFYEKYDLDQWVDWVEQQNPQGIIGVHGVSMGAATALAHAELNESSKRVKFYIADSAYSDLEVLLAQHITAIAHLHNSTWINIFLKYSSAMAYIQSRFRYDEASPIAAVKNVTTPVLYLHSQADMLVPFAMCQQLYAATKGYREIHAFSSQGHARAILDRKMEYRHVVHDFMQVALAQSSGQSVAKLSSQQ
ncbi:MAG TPA: alpha/beta hydrolase [Negativicutes bacterium]|jgi:hypothetical protein